MKDTALVLRVSLSWCVRMSCPPSNIQSAVWEETCLLLVLLLQRQKNHRFLTRGMGFISYSRSFLASAWSLPLTIGRDTDRTPSSGPDTVGEWCSILKKAFRRVC